MKSRVISHIQWLDNRISKLSQAKGSIFKIRKIWTLSYPKNSSKILFSKIYYKDNLPCLKRKYEKVKFILNTEQERLKKYKKCGRGAIGETQQTEALCS